MKTALDTEGSCSGFQKAVGSVLTNGGVKGLLVLTCAENGFSKAELDPVLKGIQVPVIGGCFPGIMCDNRVYEKGTVVIGLPVEPGVVVVDGLSQADSLFEDEIRNADISGFDGGTILVIADGLAARINSLLEALFSELGLMFSYLGGGAASLDLKQRPSVFTNEGLLQDCAVIAHLPLASGVGISHGMHSFAGPYKVTSASSNMINTIEHQPAAAFYKDVILKHPEYSDKVTGVLGLDAHFSMGLSRFDAERVILEPVKEGEGGSLLFMQEVREGEFVNFMRITEDEMVGSAEDALNQARSSLGGQVSPGTVISFDCISRKMFLGDEFNRELAKLCALGLPHAGALTCGGEIGSNGKDFLDYHNRTCVVGVFGE